MPLLGLVLADGPAVPQDGMDVLDGPPPLPPEAGDAFLYETADDHLEAIPLPRQLEDALDDRSPFGNQAELAILLLDPGGKLPSGQAPFPCL